VDLREQVLGPARERAHVRLERLHAGRAHRGDPVGAHRPEDRDGAPGAPRAASGRSAAARAADGCRRRPGRARPCGGRRNPRGSSTARPSGRSGPGRPARRARPTGRRRRRPRGRTRRRPRLRAACGRAVRGSGCRRAPGSPRRPARRTARPAVHAERVQVGPQVGVAQVHDRAVSPWTRRTGSAAARTASSSPSRASTAHPVGCRRMPAPTGPGADSCSKTSTSCPARASRSAAAGPPVPHPTTATPIRGSVWGNQPRRGTAPRPWVRPGRRSSPRAPPWPPGARARCARRSTRARCAAGRR